MGPAGERAAAAGAQAATRPAGRGRSGGVHLAKLKLIRLKRAQRFGAKVARPEIGSDSGLKFHTAQMSQQINILSWPGRFARRFGELKRSPGPVGTIEFALGPAHFLARNRPLRTCLQIIVGGPASGAAR